MSKSLQDNIVGISTYKIIRQMGKFDPRYWKKIATFGKWLFMIWN
jgi:hypothetical protein